MKSKLLIAATALLLAGCGSPQPVHRTKKFHVTKQRVYHFDDGRVGFHDDNMLWYFIIQQQNNNTLMANSPTIISGWQAGAAPAPQAISRATVEEQGVVENDQGLPVNGVEAEAVAAENGGLSEISPDAATGEISATIEFSSQIEAETGQAGETASEGTSSDFGAGDAGSSDAGSSDAGSGDSGGGGDGGGGGGSE